MSKMLRALFPEKCVGCEMCLMRMQMMLGKQGLSESLVRIFRDGKKFSVDLDPRINKLDIEEISKICPAGVFTVIEEKEGTGLV